MRKENDRKVFLLVLLIISVIGYALGIDYIVSSPFGNTAKQPDIRKHSVTVITKSMNSSFWLDVFDGAKAAATEYNLNVVCAGPDNEEDYETQNRMIEEAVKRGTEAIVFSSVDYEANAAAIDAAAKAGVKIVVIDSDVNSSYVSSRIGTNNLEAGRMAGQAALDAPYEKLNIGIVNFAKMSANGQGRENGFREIVEKDDRVQIVDAINVLSTVEDARQRTMEMLEEHPEINVVATFNEWTSLGVGYAVQQLGLAKKTTVIAFDNNAVSVGMLETGEVDALIVQNPFAMGYLGVECACNLLNGKETPGLSVDSATTLVTRENMFDEEGQRLLFSFHY